MYIFIQTSMSASCHLIVIRYVKTPLMDTSVPVDQDSLSMLTTKHAKV